MGKFFKEAKKLPSIKKVVGKKITSTKTPHELQLQTEAEARFVDLFATMGTHRLPGVKWARK